MKVCLVSHFGGLGGAERSLLELASALRGGGISPTLLVPGPSPLEQAALDRRIEVVRVPLGRLQRRGAGLGRSLGRLLAGWHAMRRVLRGLEPAVLHANSSSAMAWIGPVARSLEIPVIWHWRDLDTGPHLRALALGCDRALAISRAVQRHAERELGGRVPVAWVGNGVQDLSAQEPSASARWWDPHATLRVAMAGQAVPRKGHDVLVRAIALARRRVPGIEAVVACPDWDPEGTWAAQLQRLALREGGTRILGEIPSVAPLFHAADVVVVPSLREPFGRVAVEGMLARKPVIASDIDGLAEIVEHGRTGLRVPPGDESALAAALLALSGNVERREQMGQEGRERALALFTPEHVAKRVIAVYAELVR